jgi:hypothetical protein
MPRAPVAETVAAGSSSEVLGTDLVEAPEPDASREQQIQPFSPSFRFHFDQQEVPTQLQRLRQHSLKERREFHRRAHDVTCRLAALDALVAEGSMDFEREWKSSLETAVYAPMQQAFEREALERDHRAASHAGRNWMALEGRLSKLDAHMTHSVHVDLFDAKRDRLDRLREEVEQDVAVDVKVEAFQSNKREGQLVGRFEDTVGTVTRRYREERAARWAAIEVASQRLRDVDVPRGRDFLNQIRELRAAVAEERAQRQAEDKRLRAEIESTTNALKRAVLAAYGDPNT